MNTLLWLSAIYSAVALATLIFFVVMSLVKRSWSWSIILIAPVIWPIVWLFVVMVVFGKLFEGKISELDADLQKQKGEMGCR